MVQGDDVKVTSGTIAFRQMGARQVSVPCSKDREADKEQTFPERNILLLVAYRITSTLPQPLSTITPWRG